MSTFRLYLWKEWREQRGALFALALILPVLVAAIGFSMPRSPASGGTFVGVTSAVALVLTLVVVSGELLAFDRRRGGQWLERLPRGVAAAFPAKLSVLLGSSVLALVYGACLSVVVGLIRSRNPADAVALERDLEHVLLPIAGALALAPWVFSASAWCHRGMLAFAAGALLAGGLGFPLLAFHFTDYQAEPAEVGVAATLYLGGALVSAWLGFVHGPSLGRGLARAARIGGGAGVLSLAPILGWGLFQLHERDVFDLASPDCWFEDTWVSADGHVAVVTARMSRPRWHYARPARVLRIDMVQPELLDLSVESPRLVYTYTHIEQAGSRVATALRVLSPSGESVHWFAEADGAEVPVAARKGLGSHLLWLEPAGLGWEYLEDRHDEVRYRDPYTGVDVSRSDLGIDTWAEVMIGPAGWWICPGDEGPLFFDARADKLEQRPELGQVMYVKRMLPDGRLFVVLVDDSLALVDLPSGEIEPVLAPRDVDWIWDSFEPPLPTDPPLFRAGVDNYRLDVERRELVRLDASYEGSIVRCLADRDLVILTDEGFVRRDDETGARTTLVRFDELTLATEVTP